MSMNAAMETILVMRMQTAPTPKALTFVSVWRDILGPESHAKVEQHTNFSAFPTVTSLRQSKYEALSSRTTIQKD